MAPVTPLNDLQIHFLFCYIRNIKYKNLINVFNSGLVNIKYSQKINFLHMYGIFSFSILSSKEAFWFLVSFDTLQFYLAHTL